MCSIGFPPETMVMQAVATLHKRGHKFEELQENRVPSQNPDRGCSMASCNPLNYKCAHKFETIWICFNKGGCRPLFKGSPETAPQSPRSPGHWVAMLWFHMACFMLLALLAGTIQNKQSVYKMEGRHRSHKHFHDTLRVPFCRRFKAFRLQSRVPSYMGLLEGIVAAAFAIGLATGSLLVKCLCRPCGFGSEDVIAKFPKPPKICSLSPERFLWWHVMTNFRPSLSDCFWWTISCEARLPDAQKAFFRYAGAAWEMSRRSRTQSGFRAR